jgi:hypothetical protein
VQRLQIARLGQAKYASGFGTSNQRRRFPSARLRLRLATCAFHTDTTRQIWKHEGVRGFYRGFGAMLLTYIPGSVVWWMSYEHCKVLLLFLIIIIIFINNAP